MDKELQERMDELIRQAREADREDRKLAEALSSLVHHSSFSALQNLFNKRLQSLSEEMLAPANSVDRLIAQEYLKGAMFGLILARDLPAIIVDSLATTAKDENDG